ncbi:MAG TPA: CinA family nicotinamide mononucleotide deamidase-related protein [Flavobacteriales bacterium]|nr:CinA family nicotinamide mononucleotide deamidase-related protein [Flavobacteriales bacterium]MCC6653729.1 CinA family nicotinamide mononucleotide deamidase-related protein [Flavobacteriales bacterium]HNI03782.1 CinA family nicotinamide mononucleotide deamidase-related protein [Flavobacteriales bacterium]HNM69303.1 CinA family nicotinamide mononucleotide deamidase-related protein [Flavobacteriales bacterium]HNO05861.1 CinA family nicotinamide mononucleotide deamidase-related protein [Flavoba
MKEVTAEIIAIGDEILIGQTVDTNSGWLGGELALIGIRTVRVRAIADDRSAILEALGSAVADIVLITGGLGPTRDDLTKQVLCEFFGTRLVHRPEVERHIEDLFLRMGRSAAEVLDANRAQADLPESCTILPNSRGTASGMWFQIPLLPETNGGTTTNEGRPERVFLSMPGVPYEMRAIMGDHGLHKLRECFRPPAIVHRTILTAGMGESQVARLIEAWENSLAADGIKLAYLPSPGMLRLRLSAYANADAAEARQRVDRQAEALYRLIPELIFGEGTGTLGQAVGQQLKERGQTLALAESCTGGYLSHLITAIPGSSNYYIGGVVSYANAVKMEELGIPSDMLELNGAVSRPVAERMAQGVRAALRSDWAIATTGIAGPDGGTPDKPVGTVWLAVAGPDGVSAKLGNFPGSRELVIERAAMSGLNMLRKRLMLR